MHTYTGHTHIRIYASFRGVAHRKESKYKLHSSSCCLSEAFIGVKWGFCMPSSVSVAPILVSSAGLPTVPWRHWCCDRVPSQLNHRHIHVPLSFSLFWHNQTKIRTYDKMEARCGLVQSSSETSNAKYSHTGLAPSSSARASDCTAAFSGLPGERRPHSISALRLHSAHPAGAQPFTAHVLSLSTRVSAQ
jgi:hypothetical protein